MSSCAVERHLVWAEAPALKTCVEKLSTRPSQALSFFSFSILHLCLFLSQYVTIRLMPACWICFCCFCLSLNLIRRKVRFKKKPQKKQAFFFLLLLRWTFIEFLIWDDLDLVDCLVFRRVLGKCQQSFVLNQAWTRHAMSLDNLIYICLWAV